MRFTLKKEIDFIKTKRNKFWIKIFITGILISITIIPYAEVFVPTDNCVDDSCWKRLSIINDFTLTAMYIPYIVLCAFYLWIRKFTWIRTVIIVASFMYLLNCIFSMMIPIQDFSPLHGVLVVFSLHVSIILGFTFENGIVRWMR